MKELRTGDDVAAWLAAGLLLRRVAPRDDGDDDAFVAQALVACANELSGLPPPGVIADVATLLGGARLPLPPRPPGGDALRAALHAYDDDVLARLVTAARYDDALAAYAHLAPIERPAAVALVVGALCERAGCPGSSVSAAALRRALARPRAERDAAGRSELADDGATAQQLAEHYVRLARGARHARALVDDREVFALDHLAVLRDLGGRMTADHVAAAAEALAHALPRRLPARRLERGARDTRLADDNLYPAGGFAALTPGGDSANLENLVTSELVYMDDTPGPDVFTLRYVESELLFYTRDDSVFRRHRHVITIALGADLDDARVKDRELPWQRLALALGLVLAVVRWLADQLGDQALAIQIAFPPKLLAEERAILALLLEAEIARGAVSVVEQRARDVVDATAAAGASAIADVVIVSTGDAPDVPRGLRSARVDLSSAAPVLAAGGAALAPALDPGDAWRQWCGVAEDLLRWLV